jgi:prepilin-type N-terminal cleavage/methylation domain-containing protein
MTNSPISPRPRGFTLLELSLCLLIIGLFSGSLLVSLSAQRDIADLQAAQRQLDDSRESLLAFSLVNGRLPCPARPTLVSHEAAAGVEDCALQHGVLPWRSLALPETDPWGNRLTYYASERFSAAIPAGSNASFTLETLGNASIYDNNGKILASELPAVIICHGRLAAGAFTPEGLQISGAEGEESENSDADLSFVNHSPSPRFDDQLTWLPPNVLKARLVSAGRLP